MNEKGNLIIIIIVALLAITILPALVMMAFPDFFNCARIFRKQYFFLDNFRNPDLLPCDKIRVCNCIAVYFVLLFAGIQCLFNNNLRSRNGTKERLNRHDIE